MLPPFLFSASPNGPPIGSPRNIGIQFASASSLAAVAAMLRPMGLYSRLSLRGDSISFSWMGDVEADDRSEDAKGADIESWVLWACCMSSVVSGHESAAPPCCEGVLGQSTKCCRESELCCSLRLCEVSRLTFSKEL